MRRLRLIVGVLSIAMMVLVAEAGLGQPASTGSGQTTSTGSGQAYPNKPLRIVTGNVGGGNDFIARQISQGLGDLLGQPLIVVNLGGGRTAEVLAQSQADGYTLSVSGNNTWTAPLFRKLNYDPIRDFMPVTLIARDVNIVAVHPSVAANSIRELIAYARARPGILNFASSTFGSPQHMGTEVFKSMAGINIVGVPYKGVAPAMNALLSGEVHMIIAEPGLLAPHMKSGKLKALAVTSSATTALAPGLPTVSASGLPGYEWVGMTGMFVPTKTPARLINRLNQESARFLKRPEVKERFFGTGMDVVASSPEEFAIAIKSDMSKIAKVVKDAGIKLE